MIVSIKTYLGHEQRRDDSITHCESSEVYHSFWERGNFSINIKRLQAISLSGGIMKALHQCNKGVFLSVFSWRSMTNWVKIFPDMLFYTYLITKDDQLPLYFHMFESSGSFEHRYTLHIVCKLWTLCVVLLFIPKCYAHPREHYCSKSSFWVSKPTQFVIFS